MEKTLIVGGGGFVGRAIQAHVATDPERYVVAARADVGTTSQGLPILTIDLSDESTLADVANFEHAIWVAGNADHALGWADPGADIESQVLTLLKFLRHFDGSMTLLSSQAVYFGLSGEVSEGVDHVANMPYGFAKLAAEKYAQWALHAGRLRRLWIHRLMYAFGAHESPRRLLARCAQASHDGGCVTVAGGGRSFLNPLPVSFLADVLVRSAEQMRAEVDGFVEITNVNHPDPWTVLDVITFFDTLAPFDYEVVEGGERWPVAFHGNIGTLTQWLDRWHLRFPDVQTSLAEYRDEVVRREA